MLYWFISAAEICIIYYYDTVNIQAYVLIKRNRNNCHICYIRIYVELKTLFFMLYFRPHTHIHTPACM